MSPTRPSGVKMQMPKIDVDELETRHSQYLADIRYGVSPHYRGNREGALAYLKGAQIQYAAWFKERGVELVFREITEIAEPMSRRSSEYHRPYAVKPWKTIGSQPSYGPSAISFVQYLCYSVMDHHGRPEAVRLIKLFGAAPVLAEVDPKNYEILTRACRMKLEGKDPGPAEHTISHNPGLGDGEINP